MGRSLPGTVYKPFCRTLMHNGGTPDLTHTRVAAEISSAMICSTVVHMMSEVPVVINGSSEREKTQATFNISGRRWGFPSQSLLVPI
jgi:hypothetical protein